MDGDGLIAGNWVMLRIMYESAGEPSRGIARTERAAASVMVQSNERATTFTRRRGVTM